MELSGKIYKIEAENQVSSTFKKRLVVIETDEKYSQKIPVEFTQDKCGILDSYVVGDIVTVGINIRGNEYKEKFYVSIQGWKINKDGVKEIEVDLPF